MDYFNYNGKILAGGSPVIGADNRGLRYGDGLFETMKMKAGRIVYEDEHFARLWKGLQTLQFELPRHFSPELLQQQIHSLAKKNAHESFARIRLNVFRGDGGLYDIKSHAPNYLLQTWALSPSYEAWNSNGLVPGIYTAAQKNCDLLSNLKHNNYLPYVMAALQAKKEKWNDAVLLNNHERICDTTIANIFIIKDGIIFTPPLGEGCVAGVKRKMLIQELLQANWAVEEKALSIDDLLSADEVFLTNSLYQLRWVQSIGSSVYQHATTRKIFAGLVQTI